MILETFPVGPLQCNCSILGDEATREAMVIDPGEDISVIVKRLTKHNLTVKQIIITHAHIDHVGGAAQLRRITGAPISLHHDDLSLLSALEMQALWLGLRAVETFQPDEALRHQSKLSMPGLSADVLHTPGHTPGSICLHFQDKQVLFAGDTLFAGSIGRTDLPGGDSEQILRSLHHHLLSLPDTTLVIPGHGRVTSIGQERESNPFLQPNFRW